MVEFNASDVRNKKSLDNYVGHLIHNHGMDEWLSADTSSASSSSSSHSHPPAGKKTVVIMDEVDGIAGNEDRGGLQKLLQLIKGSRLPIICIANDVSDPRMKPLKQNVTHLIWRRPTADQIIPRLNAIATAEGLDVDTNALRKLIESTQADIRQTLNYLQMYSKTHRRLAFDTVMKAVEGGGGKDVEAGVFTIIPTFFKDPGRRVGWLEERLDLVFVDSQLVPLFVQEVYLKGKPRVEGVGRVGGMGGGKGGGGSARDVEVRAMETVSRAADYISDADTLSSTIYRDQDYTLMPTHAVISSVAPGYLMSASGLGGGMIGFPTWLGQNSSRTRKTRLTCEMHTAMALTSPSPLSSFTIDVLPTLRTLLISPFQASPDPSATVDATITALDELGLTKDDWDALQEVTDPFAARQDKVELESQVKSRFTREWNKTHHMLKASRGKKGDGGTVVGAMRVGVDELEEEEEGSGGDVGDDGEEDDEGVEGKVGKEQAAAMKKDPMIKVLLSPPPPHLPISPCSALTGLPSSVSSVPCHAGRQGRDLQEGGGVTKGEEGEQGGWWEGKGEQRKWRARKGRGREDSARERREGEGVQRGQNRKGRRARWEEEPQERGRRRRRRRLHRR